MRFVHILFCICFGTLNTNFNIFRSLRILVYFHNLPKNITNDRLKRILIRNSEEMIEFMAAAREIIRSEKEKKGTEREKGLTDWSHDTVFVDVGWVVYSELVLWSFERVLTLADGGFDGVGVVNQYNSAFLILFNKIGKYRVYIHLI